MIEENKFCYYCGISSKNAHIEPLHIKHYDTEYSNGKWIEDTIYLCKYCQNDIYRILKNYKLMEY